MSLSEALGQGVQVAVVGLVIVFSVLIILMIVMMLMKAVFYRPKSEDTVPAAPAAPAEPAPAAVQDEEELIAVLTAAVAACMNTSTYNLNIKSYRRIENHAPAWSKAGLRDMIDARF